MGVGLCSLLIALVAQPTGSWQSDVAHNSPSAPRAVMDRTEYLKSGLIAGLTMGSVTCLDAPSASALPVNEAPNLLRIPVTKEGKVQTFGDALGPRATLIVNVASYCALTPQYAGLKDLYDRFASRGFQILAFPCSQFGNQEPDPIDRIRKDVRRRFGVKFPIYDKIDVNGPNAHPLYAALKQYEPELSGYPTKISWNFEKFVIGPDGVPRRRYKPGVQPGLIAGDIEALIEKGKLGSARVRSLNDY